MLAALAEMCERRICGYQAVFGGLPLARLGRLGMACGSGVACFGTLFFTKPSNRSQAFGCSSIWSRSGFFGETGMKTNPKRKSTSRRLPSGIERKAIKAHIRQTGEVIWAWNSLQQAFAFVFTRTFPNASGFLPHALWNAVVSDSSQRDMLKAAIEWGGITGRAAPALLWALKQVGDLTVYRNDIVHGLVGYRGTDRGLKTRFSYFGNPVKRVARYTAREASNGEILEGPSLDKVMKLMRGDLLQLAEYVLQVGRTIGPAEQRPPWPRRPLLQAHNWFQGKQGKTEPRKRNRSRPTRPKSSPP